MNSDKYIILLVTSLLTIHILFNNIKLKYYLKHHALAQWRKQTSFLTVATP